MAATDTSAGVGWGRAMLAATASALVEGRWWLLSLAAFLVRGGLLLVVPAILVVPTPARLATLLSPSITGAGLSSPTPALVALVASTSAVVLAAILVTTVLGTWLDLAVVDAARVDQAVDERRTELPRPLPLWAAVEVRLAAHLPTALALVLGVIALGDAAMAELTGPSGAGPLALRIIARAPLATAAIVVSWFVGEAWGGVAIRRLARTDSTLAALGRGFVDLVRPSGLATLVLTTVVVAVPVVVLWVAAGRAFDRLWPLIVEPADDGIVAIGLGLLVASWAAGLWVLGIALSFRSAAWTAEIDRRD